MRRLFAWMTLCLLTAGCGAGLAAVPAADVTRPPATPVSTRQLATATARLTPQPPRPTAPPACPAAPPTRLILNARGRVLPDDPRPINLRSEPGTGNTPLTTIPILEIFYVLDGPVCEGEYAWYRIRYGSYEGWIAEGDANNYYVEPYLTD